jgi:hypothetical protein
MARLWGIFGRDGIRGHHGRQLAWTRPRFQRGNPYLAEDSGADMLGRVPVAMTAPTGNGGKLAIADAMGAQPPTPTELPQVQDMPGNRRSTAVCDCPCRVPRSWSWHSPPRWVDRSETSSRA